MKRDKLDPFVLECVQAGGWYDGRHTDISELARQIEFRGIKLNAVMADMLSEMQGLIFSSTKRGLQFCTKIGLEFWIPDAKKLSPLVGSLVCPLADTDIMAGWFILEDGGIIQLDMDWLFYLRAPSIEDALNAYLGNKIGFSEHVSLGQR